MSFKKLKRKLSAVLCSAMMVGGSSVSNRVAMAGGMRLQTELWRISCYGKMNLSCEKDAVADKFRGGLNADAVESVKVTFGQEYDALMYKLDLKDQQYQLTVRLFYIPDAGGFGISVENKYGTSNFGILPTSYLAYHLMKAFGGNIESLDLSVPFEDMGEEQRENLVVAVANICGANIGYMEAGKSRRAKSRIGSVGPDEKDFGASEDETYNDNISNLCIKAFWDANPMNGGKSLKEVESEKLQDQAPKEEVIVNDEEVIVNEEGGEEVKNFENPQVQASEGEVSYGYENTPVITPISESGQSFMPPSESGKPITNKKKWSKRKHLAVWGSTVVGGTALTSSPIWVRWIANRRNRSLLRNRRMMNKVGVPVGPNNGGVKSNGVSKGTRLRSRGRSKLPLKGNRAGKVRGNRTEKVRG